MWEVAYLGVASEYTFVSVLMTIQAGEWNSIKFLLCVQLTESERE